MSKEPLPKEFLEGIGKVDLSNFYTTVSVTYSPNPYTGWRKLVRRILRKDWRGPTFEFEAIPASTSTSVEFKPIGPVRKVSE